VRRASGIYLVPIKMPKGGTRMWRSVWEKHPAEAWGQEQARREQSAVHQQPVRVTRVRQRVWFEPERAKCHRQRAGRWWRLHNLRCRSRQRIACHPGAWACHSRRRRHHERERDPARYRVIETVGLCTDVVTNKDSQETVRGEFGCALILWDELICTAPKDAKVHDVRHLAGPDTLWDIATKEGPCVGSGF
jgi:hypothetical protein